MGAYHVDRPPLLCGTVLGHGRVGVHSLLVLTRASRSHVTSPGSLSAASSSSSSGAAPNSRGLSSTILLAVMSVLFLSLAATACDDVRAQG